MVATPLPNSAATTERPVMESDPPKATMVRLPARQRTRDKVMVVFPCSQMPKKIERILYIK